MQRGGGGGGGGGGVWTCVSAAADLEAVRKDAAAALIDKIKNGERKSIIPKSAPFTLTWDNRSQSRRTGATNVLFFFYFFFSSTCACMELYRRGTQCGGIKKKPYVETTMSVHAQCC